MNNLRIAGRALSVGLRQMHTTTIRRAEFKYDNSCLPQIKARHARFQKDDGLPVHLKGGPLDRALYYFTVLLCVVGGVEGCQFMYVCYTD